MPCRVAFTAARSWLGDDSPSEIRRLWTWSRRQGYTVADHQRNLDRPVPRCRLPRADHWTAVLCVSQARRALRPPPSDRALAPERRLPARELAPFRDIDAEQSFRPEYLRLKKVGWSVVPRIESGAYRLGQLLLTKHKEENFANIARAWSLLAGGGTLVCSGSNDDGAASLEKQVAGVRSTAALKFHCRVFWLTPPTDPPDYCATLLRCAGRRRLWLSQPAFFSWDRIDDGPATAATHLPDLSATSPISVRGAACRAKRWRARRHCGIRPIDAEHRAIEAAAQRRRPRPHYIGSPYPGRPRHPRRDRLHSPFHTFRAAERTGQTVIVRRRVRSSGGRFYMGPIAPAL